MGGKREKRDEGEKGGKIKSRCIRGKKMPDLK